MSLDFLHTLFSNVWTLALVVLFFAGSIFVHELGHFLAARWRGVRVERFSIGFGPAIVAWTGKDGVEYRLSWIPFGGYVLLPQLADLGPLEGQKNVYAEPLPPISYLSKLIVFVAGAAFNVLFAFVLACVVWIAGQPNISGLSTTQIGTLAPTIKLANGSKVTNPAIEAGLKPGDFVRSVDGIPVKNFEDILTNIFLGHGRTDDGRRKTVLVIDRDGQSLQLTVYPRLVGDEGLRSAGIEPADDLTVDEVMPGSPALAAGVQHGDRIVAVDGERVYQTTTVSELVTKNANRPIEFQLLRGGQEIHLKIQPHLEVDATTGKDVPRVGIRYRFPEFEITHPSPFAQIADNVTSMFRNVVALLSPTSDIGPSKLTGPIGIVHELHRYAQWDFRGLLAFTILINVNLAILNLMPVPVFDGGQIVFATLARLRGRPLPVNVIITTQSVFMVLILSMVIYLSFFDVARIRRENRLDSPHLATPAPATAPAKP